MVLAPDADEILRRLPLPEPLRGRPGVYAVGGAVRDVLLGRPVLDLDLAVEDDLAGLAAELGVTVNERFGTARAVHGDVTIDLARTRRERYPQPGALPVVEPAGIEEDLRRRDFTVNALAVPLVGGELLAVDGALADLAAGRLGVLHDASFREDPTRLFRLARYAARLGFGVTPRTEERLAEALRARLTDTLSPARIGQELRLLAAEPDPVEAFAALRHFRIDATVAPGFGLNDLGLLERAERLLGTGGRRDLLALGACVLGSALDAERLEAMEFPAADRDFLLTVMARAEKVSWRLEMAGPPSEIDAVARPYAPEFIALAGAIGPTSAAREWLAELRLRTLAITGEDLLAAGVPAGPGVGAGLAAARAAMLDGEAPDRDAQLAVAVRAAHKASA